MNLDNYKPVTYIAYVKNGVIQFITTDIDAGQLAIKAMQLTDEHPGTHQYGSIWIKSKNKKPF